MNNKIMLSDYSKGSYGNIFKDCQLNIYKITIMCEGGTLTSSNINENIFLNKFLLIKKKLINTNTENNFINLLSFDEKSYKTLIDENIFMQSIKTEYYDNRTLIKNYDFINKNTQNYYETLTKGRVDKILLFNKLPTFEINLFKFIKKSHIDILNNFDIIAKKLIKSLAVFHHNGFLHGDLKSGNILLNNLSDVCLTDFGGIKYAFSNNYYLSCTLTARCPEDLNYDNENTKIFQTSDYKSDIWSLGLIFAEMILGYNPIHKIYHKLNDYKLNDKMIEKELINYYERTKYINISNLLKTNPDAKVYMTKDLSEKVSVIEKMLIILPEKRIGTIEEVYEKLFKEKFEFNFEVNYTYDYTKLSNESYDNFLKIRSENYSTIITICNTINSLYFCPLIFDILDRLFIKLLSKINDNSIDLSKNNFNFIAASIILLVSGLFNQQQPNYIQLLSLINLKNNSLDIGCINKNLLDIMHILDYDLIRPFNIFYCPYLQLKTPCKCYKNILKNKQNEKYVILHENTDKDILRNILYDIVKNNTLNISPSYYYYKLLL